MAYRANGSYLRFRTNIRTENGLPAVGRTMTKAIWEHRRRNYLQDMPSVRKSQNVYDALSE